MAGKHTPTDIDFINLNDISDGFEMIPEADYHMKIVEADVRENKAKDGYYVNYRAVVQSGDKAGASVFGMWSLKDTAAWKLKRDFKAMGYSPPDGKPHIADLLGFEGIAQVIIKPAQGEYPAKNDMGRWLSPLK